MLYIKTQVANWFNQRGNWFLCDHFIMVDGVTVHNVEYVDIKAIRTAVESWARPIVAPGADPTRIVAELQSDLIGFIPTPSTERKTYFGDGDHDFCHGMTGFSNDRSTESVPNEAEIDARIEAISNTVRDLQIRRRMATQDLIQLERIKEDLVTLERVKDSFGL